MSYVGFKNNDKNFKNITINIVCVSHVVYRFMSNLFYGFTCGHKGGGLDTFSYNGYGKFTFKN